MGRAALLAIEELFSPNSGCVVRSLVCIQSPFCSYSWLCVWRTEEESCSGLGPLFARNHRRWHFIVPCWWPVHQHGCWQLYTPSSTRMRSRPSQVHGSLSTYSSHDVTFALNWTLAYRLGWRPSVQAVEWIYSDCRWEALHPLLVH